MNDHIPNSSGLTEEAIAANLKPDAKPKFSIDIMTEREGQELLDIIDVACKATGIQGAATCLKWAQRITGAAQKAGLETA